MLDIEMKKSLCPNEKCFKNIFLLVDSPAKHGSEFIKKNLVVLLIF